MSEKLYAVMELGLLYPYSESCRLVADLASLWSCRIMRLSSNGEEATIGMPVEKFNMIFGEIPQLGKWKVPQGTEHFISSVKVTDIDA
jgi:hypothetical protein